MYVEYYNNQNKSKLEMDRLWTYYTMLPHINTKKIKSPKDLIKFNWEVDDKKSIENITEDDFDAMINSAPKFK